MPTAEYDLNYLKAGLEQLDAYLLSRNLYWPVQIAPRRDEAPYPQMTPGALLLASRRLEVTAKTPAQQDEYRKLTERMEQITYQWRTAWGKKTRLDFSARLNRWGNFLEEYRERPSANADRYPYEVQRRVQLHLLGPHTLDMPPAMLDNLSGLDGLLQAVFIPGPFVWEANLEPAFPSAQFWFLYGRLRSDLPEERG